MPIGYNCQVQSYLNDALHEVSFVINQLSRGLALDQVLDGVDITEAQRLDVIDETRRLVVLQESAIASLVGQRLARGVDGLRIPLKNRDHLGALHLVVVLVGGGFPGRRHLGEALAVLLAALRLGVAIGVLVALELGRESAQHDDDYQARHSLLCSETKMKSNEPNR